MPSGRGHCATLTVTASLASRLDGDEGMTCQTGHWIPVHKVKDESTSSPLGVWLLELAGLVCTPECGTGQARTL